MRPRLVGMVHLPALPGMPNHRGEPLADIARMAVEDAVLLDEAGFDAVMVQNSLDRPSRVRVDSGTVAQLTRVCTEIRHATSTPLAVNVHKNDGPAAVAVAAAVSAEFVRVKVHTGCVLGAEGLIQGCAHETLQMRRRLGADIEIWADVHDSTSRPLQQDGLLEAAVDATDFGAADVLIITRSNVAESVEKIRQLRSHVGEVPMIIGGKVTASTAEQAYRSADGIIVGSALKTATGITGRIDTLRAQEFVRAAKRASHTSASGR